MRIPMALLGVATLLTPTGSLAQEPIDREMLARIEAEGTERSQVGELFFHLTDVIGARLTGSESFGEAAEWARDRLTAWGLSGVRLEPYDFGRGWELEKLTLEMTSPRYMPLIGYPEAWTPSTDGAVSGRVAYVGARSLEEVDAMAGELRGAIVLTSLPQENFLLADRPQPGVTPDPVRTGNPRSVPARSTADVRQLIPRLQAAGAAVLIRPNPHQHGTVLVLGSRTTPDDAVPSIVMAAEQYNLLVRLVEAGEPVELTVEVRTRYQGPTEGNGINVLAEIPGTDPELRNEVVLIGAHLDSWHTSNGATDNGDGVVGVMEAMRILAALDARPRRTIRVALWGGEEQGLLGARAYVADRLATDDARERLAVYLNDDPGTGRTFGFYMQENGAAKAIFDEWLAPLAQLGVTRNVIDGIGSTDHVPFDQVGLPAFTAIKDFRDYDVRSRHTNQDFLERVSEADLRQAAIVMASFAWQAAMRDEVVAR